MQNDKAPEFDLQRPFASAISVIVAVLFSPRSFYLNFKVEGPLREPAVFVLLVGAVSGVLGAAVALSSNLLFGDFDAGDLRAALRRRPPLCRALAGRGRRDGRRLPSLHQDVRREGVGFRGGLPHGRLRCSALVLAWIPVLGAFAFTYALMVLMGIGIQSAYRTSFITTVVTVLAGFVPVASVLIWLIITEVAS